MLSLDVLHPIKLMEEQTNGKLKKYVDRSVLSLENFGNSAHPISPILQTTGKKFSSIMDLKCQMQSRVRVANANELF